MTSYDLGTIQVAPAAPQLAVDLVHHTEVMLSAEEARQIVKNINGRFEQSRKDLIELEDREGWRALGYGSWRACVMAEFTTSVATLYRQLEAAKIEREVFGDVSQLETPTPTAQLQVVKNLPTEQKRAAFKRADQIAGDQPRTAAHVRQAATEIAQPDLPPEFAIIQRRFESHGHVLSAAWDGVTRRYVVRKDGGTGVVMLWPDVLSKLEGLEAEPTNPAPTPDPAVEMEIKRLCAISGSKYLGIPDLPYPTATRYRIAMFSGGGGDYLADEALEQLRDECDKRAAVVNQQSAPAAEPPAPALLPPVPARPKRPVSADASAVIAYLKQMETYASALETVIMELQKRLT